LPLIGQFLLVLTIFQNTTGKLLTYIGMGCLAILFLFMFVIGGMSQNIKILLSTIPFILVAILTIRHYMAMRVAGQEHLS